MPRTLRLMVGVFVGLLHWGDSRTELKIDMKRVNAELRRVALAGLDEDVVYRERVKQRIREGARCTNPPLIDRNRVALFRGAAQASRAADIASC